MNKLILPLLALCGVISAQAAVFDYAVNLDGPSEPNGTSPGLGQGTVSYDDTAHTLSLSVNFAGLVGLTTVAHIHAATAQPFTGTASVATTSPTFAGFPAGVSSGSYSKVLDLTLASSFHPNFISNNGGTTATAEVALANAMAAGKAYWNIHTSTSPGGEIRGFLVAVPEPSTLALVGLGICGLALRSRSRAR